MSRCRVCGGESLHALFQSSDRNFHTTDEVFLIERCRDCGVAQTSPVPEPDAIGRYYPPVYYPAEPVSRAQFERRLSRFQKDKVSIVRRHRAAGNLLDVGCGVGAFVREAVSAGYVASGIELSRDAVAFGRKMWSLSLQQGDLLQAELAEGSFDVITLWQVLEHLPHPNETLQRIRKLLREDGLLVVAVPNLSSVQARLFRGRWYHLDVPRHLFHYDRASLRALLATHGYTVLAEHHHDREHNWAGIMGSVIPFSPPRKSAVGVAARRLLAKPVCRLLAAIESRFGRGGTLTCCAVKTG